MSDGPQGPGWWMASDGRWYPPQGPSAWHDPPGRRWGKWLGLGIVGFVVLAGGLGVLSADDDDAATVATGGPTTTMTRSAFTTLPAPTEKRVRGFISRSDVGEDWPLTVEAGVLRCEGASSVTFETGGQRYAVNGTAMGTTDYPAIDAIWAPNPDYPDLKKNIGILIERGLRLCD